MTDLRESIERDGFAILPPVVPQTAIEDLDRSLAQRPIQRSRAGVRHATRFEPVTSLAQSIPLLGIARKILGIVAFPFRATFFDKTPQADWLVVWHQDTALPLRERKDALGWGPWSVKDGFTYAHAPASALESVLALRLHLDDSTAHNGPLHGLPGTHRLGLLGDGAIENLAAEIAPVECHVPRGGVLAMRPLLHASSKSRSDAPRRVLHIEYAATPSLANGLTLRVT